MQSTSWHTVEMLKPAKGGFYQYMYVCGVVGNRSSGDNSSGINIAPTTIPRNELATCYYVFYF